MSELKVHRMKMVVKADDKTYTGEYTLIMLLRSPRCFGFKFNRIYKTDSPELYLLLIEAPKEKRFAATARLFCRLFRSFFIGFNKEHHGKIEFFPCSTVNVSSDEEYVYCLDGEKFQGKRSLECNAEITDISLEVIKKKLLRSRKNHVDQR